MHWIFVMDDVEAKQLAEIQADVDRWPAVKRRRYLARQNRAIAQDPQREISMYDALIRVMLVTGESAIACRNMIAERLASGALPARGRIGSPRAPLQVIPPEFFRGSVH